MNATEAAPPKAGGGVIAGVSERLRTFVCGLGGHDVLLKFEPGRLSLQCTSCQYETPGWTIKQSPASKEPDTQQGRQPRGVLIEQNAQ